jgi:hypothetical protein
MNSSTAPVSQRIYRWFGHPVVGIIGFVATIIAIPLSYYFYVKGDHRPDLTYFVYPGKSALVRAREDNAISVAYEGRPVQSDLTSARVAVWNAGSRAIHRNEVLTPLRIYTSPSVPIVQVRVVKQNRSVTGIGVDNSRRNAGEITVQWSILEENDGAIIQVIYAGGDDIDVLAEAEVEGQPKITREVYKSERNSTVDTEYANAQRYRIVRLLFAIVVGAVFFTTAIAKSIREIKQRKWIPIIPNIIMMLIVCYLINADILHHTPITPFGP